MVFKILLLLSLHGFFFWCLGNGQACNSLGFICTSCTSLQLCTDEVPSSANLTCSSGSYCDSTSSSYCSSTVCTTEPEAYYDCTTSGRYAVSNNCSQYIFCSNNTSGVLVPTLYDCPNGTLFNPDSAVCVLDSDYTCTDDTTTTVAATTVTDATSTTTEAATTVTDATSTTTEAATTVTDATSTTTEAATTVTDDTSTTTVAATTVTDATSTTTVAATTASTTTVATTTVTAATSTTTEAAATCTSSGRFPDTTDTTCQAYYFCYLESDSTYTMTDFTCPTTTVFNANTQKCVASSAYTCPY